MNIMMNNLQLHDYIWFKLCALFTTENTVKCSFSLDAGCFGARENIYRELGKKIAIPSKLTAIKMMLMPLLPKWIANYIPIPWVTYMEVLKWPYLTLFWFIPHRRIVPRDVDKWFRELITQNRKSRENVPIPNEDLLNALLNTAEKLGNERCELMMVHRINLIAPIICRFNRRGDCITCAHLVRKWLRYF